MPKSRHRDKMSASESSGPTPVERWGASYLDPTATTPRPRQLRFRDQVRNKAPWDYKQRGPEYRNFGNFNYGATGRALGVPGRVLLREAGRAQQAAGTSRPEWGDPGSRFNPWGGTGSFGDDPQDQPWIRRGFEYYNRYTAP